MSNKNTLIGILIIVILFVGSYYVLEKKDMKGGDASYISTTTPLSESSTTKPITYPIKKTPSTITLSTNYLKIGERTVIKGVYITPSKVVYDSRCPKDVQCIQAGSVDLGVLLENGTSSQNVIITLGKEFTFAGKILTLTEVYPSKIAGKTIKESEYRFLITVK